jgi:hypothetical protein
LTENGRFGCLLVINELISCSTSYVKERDLTVRKMAVAIADEARAQLTCVITRIVSSRQLIEVNI